MHREPEENNWMRSGTRQYGIVAVTVTRVGRNGWKSHSRRQLNLHTTKYISISSEVIYQKFNFSAFRLRRSGILLYEYCRCCYCHCYYYNYSRNQQPTVETRIHHVDWWRFSTTAELGEGTGRPMVTRCSEE